MFNCYVLSNSLYPTECSFLSDEKETPSGRNVETRNDREIVANNQKDITKSFGIYDEERRLIDVNTHRVSMLMIRDRRKEWINYLTSLCK